MLHFKEERAATDEERLVAEADRRDFTWLANHSREIWERYKGYYIAVVNEELFVAKTREDVLEQAKDKYPGRDPFVHYIPYNPRIMVL